MGGNKLGIIFLILITIVLGVGAIIIGGQLSRSPNIDPDDSSAANVCCGSGQCIAGPNAGNSFGEDFNYGGGSCDDRKRAACGSVENTSGSNSISCDDPKNTPAPTSGGDGDGDGDGGTPTNTCSGAGNAGGCSTVGQVVPYGSGNSCQCQRTTGTLCACVPTSGTTCQSVNDSSTGCTSVGSSCNESDGRLGTCQSAGTNNNALICTCNTAPGATPTTPGATLPPAADCTRDSDCNTGNYCNSSDRCQAKHANGYYACGGNNQCLSGVCSGSTCVAAGTPGGCTDDSGCAGNQWCDLGACRADRALGGDCTRNGMCTTGICASLRCTDLSTGACGSTPHGQWACENNTGFGQLCSNGTLGGRTKSDACAIQIGTTSSCANLTTQSTGESNNGRFVGCSGNFNCFCPHGDQSTQGGIQPSCYSDVGNDSCGAANNTGGVEATPIPVGPTQSTSDGGGDGDGDGGTSYCGDGVLNTGELCEPGTQYTCNNGQTCNQNCQCQTGPYCGDGVIQTGEQCDYGSPATDVCAGGLNCNPFGCNCTSEPVCGEDCTDDTDCPGSMECGASGQCEVPGCTEGTCDEMCVPLCGGPCNNTTITCPDGLACNMTTGRCVRAGAISNPSAFTPDGCGMYGIPNTALESSEIGRIVLAISLVTAGFVVIRLRVFEKLFNFAGMGAPKKFDERMKDLDQE